MDKNLLKIEILTYTKTLMISRTYNKIVDNIMTAPLKVLARRTKYYHKDLSCSHNT